MLLHLKKRFIKIEAGWKDECFYSEKREKLSTTPFNVAIKQCNRRMVFYLLI